MYDLILLLLTVAQYYHCHDAVVCHSIYLPLFAVCEEVCEFVLFICPLGTHSVEVSYDDAPVPKSPFRVAVTEGCDPARVRVHGPGLKCGITNKPNKFTVETR